MFKYNVVSRDGEATSITVFIGSESYVASADHPNFAKIIDAVRASDTTQDRLVGLFDLSRAVGRKFDRLSERVTVAAGRIHFDGVEVHSALTETIAKFYLDDQEDFKPLVAFMEKIETNPSEHSRQHLFRWLVKHRFTLCPDGDFLAYKGVDTTSKSIHGGDAIVNNEWVSGKVLNAPGTIIEMPRNMVTFDPHVGCSTGLHAGNWGYARGFSQGKVLRVKINPRDVVSVPTDSNDEKLRVCRYRILDVVTEEDRSMLYLGDLDRRTQYVQPKKAEERAAAQEKVQEAPKPKRPARLRAQKPEAPVKLPRYYEQFTAEDFSNVLVKDLRWLARQWGIKEGRRPTRESLTQALVAEGAERRKTWK